PIAEQRGLHRIVRVPLQASSYSVAVLMISPQQEQGFAMLGPAHSLTGSSPGSRPDVSNPRTRSRTCASSNTFPLEPAIDAARSGHRIGSPSVGDARGVVKEVSDRMRPEIVGIYAGRGGAWAVSVACVVLPMDWYLLRQTGSCLKDWTLTGVQRSQTLGNAALL